MGTHQSHSTKYPKPMFSWRNLNCYMWIPPFVLELCLGGLKGGNERLCAVKCQSGLIPASNGIITCSIRSTGCSM